MKVTYANIDVKHLVKCFLVSNFDLRVRPIRRFTKHAFIYNLLCIFGIKSHIQVQYIFANKIRTKM